MVLINITVNGQLTNSARFETTEDANFWYDTNLAIFEQGHVKTITDISLQVLEEQFLFIAKNKCDFGKEIILLVHVINNKKLANGLITLENLISILEDPLIVKIERFLMHGSIEIALSLIQTLPSTYFTSEELDLVTDKIETFLSTL